MKASLLLPSLLALGLATGCASAPTVTPAPDYNKIEADILKDVAPRVVGRWTLEEVDYKRRPYFTYPTSMVRDTVLRQFATLTIKPLVRASHNGNPEFEGEIKYLNKTYPIYFSLYASGGWVVRQQGPPTYFTLQYYFPDGTSHYTEPEEQFLQDIGLVGEQFSLEVEAGQPTMRWQGLDRHLRSITLRRQ
jgi:hypothetical protein